MFVVLGRPDRVRDLEIDFTAVHVVCRDNRTFLEVAGGASWSETAVFGDEKLEYYELSIYNIRLRSVSCGHKSYLVHNIYM